MFPDLTRRCAGLRSPGLRFGDQILQINDESVAGYDMDKVHGIFKKARSDAIKVSVAGGVEGVRGLRGMDRRWRDGGFVCGCVVASWGRGSSSKRTNGVQRLWNGFQ